MARITPEKTILERLDEMEKKHKELIEINKELEEKISKSEKVISESAHEARHSAADAVCVSSAKPN